MAALQERFVALGIADIDNHVLVPAIGYSTKLRIKRRPQFRDEIGQRIGKIFVLAASKPMASHHHPAAETIVVGIERHNDVALVRRQQSLQDDATLRVEIAGRLPPVDRFDARGDVGRWSGLRLYSLDADHFETSCWFQLMRTSL